jgi:hypothetical protein
MLDNLPTMRSSMKAKATVMAPRATRAVELRPEQKVALDHFYKKVREEAVPDTLRDMEARHTNAMRVRRNAFR